MNKTSRRILAIGLPLSLVAATGAAVAFWSGSGSGTASASVASAAAPVELSLASPLTGLMPGATIEVPVRATNPNADTSVAISTLTASGLTAGTACDGVSGATVTALSPTAAVVVPPGGAADFGTITLSMANTADNQDLCKGATFTVTLAAS